MSTRRYDFLTAATCAFGFAISAAVYSRLPDRVATHFDLAGQPNGWMSRPWAAFFMPVFGTLVVLVVRAAYRLMPRAKKTPSADGILAIVTTLLAVFLVVLHAGILSVALVPGFPIGRVVWSALAFLWFSLALLLPKVERNAFVGVRTAWTLASPENWARTHRIASYTFGVGALGMLPAAVVPTYSLQLLAFISVMASALVPAVYSMVVAQQKPR